MSGDAALPVGFRPSSRTSPYLEMIGPVAECELDEYRVGLRVEARHTNSRGLCHGGVLLALADIHLGRLVALEHATGASPITIGLSQTFLRGARLGQWLEATGSVDHMGSVLATATGLILADGKPAARAVANFKVAS